MQDSQERDLLRAKVKSSALYRVFNVCFAVLFIVTIVLAIVANRNSFYSFNPLLLLGAAAAGTFVIFLVARLFSALPVPPLALESTVVVLLFVFLFILQVYIGYSLWSGMESASSDAGQVFIVARNSVLSGASPGAYLEAYPRNMGLYGFWVGIFSFLRMFGITEFFFPAMVLNAAIINVSVLLLYFCVRRLFGPQKAIFVIVASFFILPFVSGAGLLLPELIVLPIPIAAVFLWIRTRSFWRNGEIKSAYANFCVLSVLLGLGALVKMSVLVVFVAIAIDLLVLVCGKGRFLLFLSGLACVAVVFLALSFVGWNLASILGTQQVLPDHFLSTEDALQTGQQSVEEAYASDGAGGVISSLTGRMSAAFGDGSYSLSGEFEAARDSGAKEFLAASGMRFPIIAYVTFGLLAGILVWMVVGALKSVYRKNDALSFARVALFGLMLFILFWPAGPRTIITFLPILIITAMEAAPVPLSASARRARLFGAQPAAGERADRPLHLPSREYERSIMKTGAFDIPLDDGRDMPDYMNPEFAIGKPPPGEDVPLSLEVDSLLSSGENPASEMPHTDLPQNAQAPLDPQWFDLLQEQMEPANLEDPDALLQSALEHAQEGKTKDEK